MIDHVAAKDFCCFEDVFWPLANRGLVWVGGENRDSDGAESNGSGKTTLYKVLSWALYGKTVDGFDKDEVIREGAKKAETTAAVGDYRIVRTRHKGSGKLKLLRNGEEVGGGTKEIQERINKILGMDWETFRNTVLYGQRDTERFLSADDATRKELLHKMLKTSAISVAHEAAKEEGKKLKRQIATTETEYERAAAALVEYDMDELKKRSDEWKEARRARVERQKEIARGHAAEAKKISAESPDVEALKVEASFVEAIFSGEAELRERERRAEEKRTKLSTLQIEQKFEIQRAQGVVDSIESALEKFEGSSECPLCHGSLEGDEAKAHIFELRTKLAEEEQARDAAKTTREELLCEREVHEKELEAISESKEQARKARKKHAKIREQISEAKLVEQRAEQARDRARQAVARAKEIHAEENPHAAAYKTAKRRNSELSEAMEKAKEKISKLQNDLAHVQFWIQGFGPSGLPSFMLDAVMPTLTERANFYLEKLSDGDITMEFSTQKELKSGDVRDKIGVTWNIEGAQGHAPSGGQWKKMELATDFALMDIVASKDSAHPEILLLDECLDGLDAEGRNRVSQLLHDMRSVRRSIFVISHDPQMSEVFERGIQISKRDGIATLKEAA